MLGLRLFGQCDHPHLNFSPHPTPQSVKEQLPALPSLRAPCLLIPHVATEGYLPRLGLQTHPQWDCGGGNLFLKTKEKCQ